MGLTVNRQMAQNLTVNRQPSTVASRKKYRAPSNLA